MLSEPITYVPLNVRPIELKDANGYVRQLHRHHGAARGCKFSIAVVDDAEKVRGVAIVGRPARMLQDGRTCEVLRVAADGARNACSMLYGACARVAKAMGYWLIVTYVLVTETGTSLVAAGWTRDPVESRGGLGPGRAALVTGRKPCSRASS